MVVLAVLFWRKRRSAGRMKRSALWLALLGRDVLQHGYEPVGY